MDDFGICLAFLWKCSSSFQMHLSYDSLASVPEPPVLGMYKTLIITFDDTSPFTKLVPRSELQYSFWKCEQEKR